MTSRERFEEWHIEHVSRKPRLDAPKGLCEDDKKAWAAWQEAERQALERAIDLCDPEFDEIEAIDAAIAKEKQG